MRNGVKKLNVRTNNVRLFSNIEAERNSKSKKKQFRSAIIFAMKCTCFNKLLNLKIKIIYLNILKNILLMKRKKSNKGSSKRKKKRKRNQKARVF